MLTKKMAPDDVTKKLLKDGEYSLLPSHQEEAEEEHRKSLRQGQRQRAKEKKKAQRAAGENGSLS